MANDPNLQLQFNEYNHDESKENDHQIDEDFELDFLNMIVIKHDSPIVLFWNTINIICCLTSCYFYGWKSLFGLQKDDQYSKILILFYESVFFIKICIKFLTEYIPEGE